MLVKFGLATMATINVCIYGDEKRVTLTLYSDIGSLIKEWTFDDVKTVEIDDARRITVPSLSISRAMCIAIRDVCPEVHIDKKESVIKIEGC